MTHMSLVYRHIGEKSDSKIRPYFWFDLGIAVM